MIKTIQLGEKHKEVANVEFGTGDICMTKIRIDDLFGITFAQTEPRPIGFTHSNYANKSTDEFNEEVKVAFTFTKPESITALIHSLVELQQSMYNGKFDTEKQ